jgi:hypothetical protein
MRLYRYYTGDFDGLVIITLHREKIIKHLEKDVERLEAKVKKWEDWKAGSKDRHAKGKAKADLAISKNKQKTKNPTNPNKQKMGFLKKHKPKK